MTVTTSDGVARMIRLTIVGGENDARVDPPQAVFEDEELADTITKNFQKKGSAAKGLAWFMQETVKAAAEVADKRNLTRAQQQMQSAQRSQEGRIAFFQDHPHLLAYADKVDALVSKGIHPVEAAKIIGGIVPAQTQEGVVQPSPQQSVGAPGLTRDQIEAILRTGSATTPAVMEHQEKQNWEKARQKMVSDIEAQMEKAGDPEDVWAALRKYKT